MSDALVDPATDTPEDYFYEHSGAGGLVIPAALLAGLPVAFLLSAVYSYIVVYCPVVGYPNILFLGGLVVGVGTAQAWIARFARCRSPFLMGIVGLMIGVATLYFAWAFFVKALVQYSGDQPLPILDVIASPGWLWETAV